MKNLLSILFILILSACSDVDVERKLGQVKAVVLNKNNNYISGVRGPGWYEQKVYIYDGTESNWFYCDIKTYNSLKIGDSLNCLSVVIIQTKK